MEEQLVLACPINVVINENPLDNTKTYQVTFIGRSKKPFTVGPGSIKYIIEELVSRGKDSQKRRGSRRLNSDPKQIRGIRSRR